LLERISRGDIMPQLSPDRYFAEIEASTAGLAEIVAEHDQNLPIPTCPEWTLRQLVTHVGRAHRWAAEITRTRSDAFIPFREVPDGKLPDHRAERLAWLRPGAALIVGAVRDAGSDLVWTFTGPAASLLLVLMRRWPVPDPAVTVYGDSTVVDGWLANTAF
jgi:uncharacterized protein (TIGR03083 family)